MANVQVCDIHADVLALLNKFKFRREKNVAAIVLKVDFAKQLVILDEEYEDCTVEEVANELPASQPRYVVLSYVHNHQDGRVSYPLIFIFCTPQGCKPEHQMMYAGTKLGLVNAAKFTKVFEIRNPEELTEEFILEKLQLFR
ncbi:glia maturation factor beta-like [Haliotis rubra]|uniref:glia maturation factor beta-like n=1 Tax=Haliotis rubra TaxID=36100 RepID=UPI001EE62E7C|nr:glia maturation factor beta-like [Haliotis rubra]